jgi:hypothetical protein
MMEIFSSPAIEISSGWYIQMSLVGDENLRLIVGRDKSDSDTARYSR